MTSTSADHAPTHSLLALFRRSLPRDEFFAALYIIGCANGIGGGIIQAANSGDWTNGIRNVSMIVWLAAVAGVSLLLDDKDEKVRRLDLFVGTVVLLLVAIPVVVMNWVALTGLSLYVLLITPRGSSRRRGATILLALTVPMLWSRVLFAFFAKFFLEFDATLVAWVLGTSQAGNMVRFADNSGELVILPACSSLANVSLAFLLWVTAVQWTGHRWSPRDILWCSLACASVVAINVTRITVEGFSQWHYTTFHSPEGDLVVNLIIMVFTMGFTVLGVRRELFAHA